MRQPSDVFYSAAVSYTPYVYPVGFLSDPVGTRLSQSRQKATLSAAIALRLALRFRLGLFGEIVCPTDCLWGILLEV